MITPNSKTMTLQTFGGLDRSTSADIGFFADLCNTSSRSYPYLSTRKKRLYLSDIGECPSALYSVGGITYTAGKKVYFNNVLQYDGLSESKRKTIVSMGGKIIVFPDGFYFNSLSLDPNGISTEFGFLHNLFSAYSGKVTLLPCISGEPIPKTVSALPEIADNGDYCLDISVSPAVLYRFAASSKKWTSVMPTHICINAAGIDQKFSIGDGISVSGTDCIDGANIITDISTDTLIISGNIEDAIFFSPSAEKPFTVSRSIPKLDFVCEHNNRLWGCRYGLNSQGVSVNEIYASKLGDPKNWNVFSGLSTDSYSASCGSDGPFTGIVSHMGYVVFFKEKKIHRLFGTKPSNFTIYEDQFNGVATQSEASLCVLGNMVFYNSPEGICVYTGSEPKIISKQLGKKKLNVFSASANNGLYRICCTEQDGTVSNYVYDTEKNIWHKEDDSCFIQMVPVESNTLAVKNDNGVFCFELLGNGDLQQNISTSLPSSAQTEQNFNWFAESGIFNCFVSNSEYIKNIKLRLKLNKGSSLKIFIQTSDSLMWRECGSVNSDNGISRFLRINIPRCDQFKIKLSGYGECTLYSVTATVESASEVT